MRELPNRTAIIQVAEAVGAVPYSPAPMRMVKGVSFTFAQLDDFVNKMINPNAVLIDKSEGKLKIKDEQS